MPDPAGYQPIEPGEIYWANPTDTVGSEQSFDRPFVIMSRRTLNAGQTVVVVPLSTRLEKAKKQPAFCIRIPATEIIPTVGSTPSVDSVALCHQVRVFDRTRLRKKYGKLTLTAVISIQLGLAYLFDIQ
jgi:mRNA interferase MazF